MSLIKNIEQIPEEVRAMVDAGLTRALKKGSLGKTKIDFIQIENSLSGGKTGAVVFVARYGSTLITKQGQESTTFIRVLKIAPKDVCESENEGYVKTRELLLDIFSQVEYYPEDEFIHVETGLKTVSTPNVDKSNKPQQYGILLYQDVGTIAASDLKGIAKYLTSRILTLPAHSVESEKFSRELSMLLQKDIFLGLKKGLYGTVKRRDVNLSQYYGNKLNSTKVRQGLEELIAIDSTIPSVEAILEFFNIHGTYHEANYVHGDLNPENVLVWTNERGYLSCKLIDFGEVIPKKRENFTPLFWDFARLLGEMILNFVEEILVIDARFDSAHRTDSSARDSIDQTTVDNILNDFWTVIEAFFRNDSSKLENSNARIEYISRIYLSTLFDFINEAKSGLKDLRRVEVIQDYFYCQILFLLFFAKFQNQNPYKRLFGVKLAIKLHDYVLSGELALQSLIESLERFYFEFSSGQNKDKHPIQIGPASGSSSPFMGLSYFQEKDRKYFFGRKKITKELLKAIEVKPFIALAGASGSGKSSVVHAGIIPRLREKDYLIYKFRPGVNPYNSMVHALVPFDSANPSESKTTVTQKEKDVTLRLSKGDSFTIDMVREPHHDNSLDLKELIGSILKANPNKRIFLLGDQFEEIFTLCTDSRQRENLSEAIIHCAKEFKDRFRFFITIRSDFWTHLLDDVGFSSIVGDSGDFKDLGKKFFLSPMNAKELRSAIKAPLRVAKLQIQDGLTDLILSSILKEPGSLPLLEFCLEELWKRQTDYKLNYKAYKEIGEVKGTLATYAENIYSALSESETKSIQKIMLQLIQPGQGTEDTRRIALIEDVGSDRDFVYTLADKRLIVINTNEEGKQILEIVHEALIREWKRLREWIDADREFRIWQEKLRYAVTEWEKGNREEGLLLHASSLANADDWYLKRKEDLSEREIKYIETSQYRSRRKKRNLIEVNTLKDAILDISSTLDLPQLSMKAYINLKGLLHSLGGAVCSINKESFQVIRADYPLAARRAVHEVTQLSNEMMQYFLEKERDEKKFYFKEEINSDTFLKLKQAFPSLIWTEADLVLPLIIDNELLNLYIFGMSSEGESYSFQNLDIILQFLLHIKASFQNALLFQKEQKLRLRFQEYATADVVEELLNEE